MGSPQARGFQVESVGVLFAQRSIHDLVNDQQQFIPWHTSQGRGIELGLATSGWTGALLAGGTVGGGRLGKLTETVAFAVAAQSPAPSWVDGWGTLTGAKAAGPVRRVTTPGE